MTLAQPALLDRRSLLLHGAAGVAALVASGGCEAAAAQPVSLPSFRQPGDPDDSAALARALATGRPVHAPAGGGSGPGGRYIVGTTAAGNLPSGASLFGDGIGRTIFKRPGPSHKSLILHCDSGSPDRAHNIAGLRFRDLSFEDDVARLGYAEFSYLVMLNGVSDVVFERVGFRGFRGDGLHIGSSAVSRTERHNVGVTVRDCVFDGVNANNRNAISVIDCDRLLIEGCQFLNCTRTGDGTAVAGDPMNPLTGLAQPGAIDLEPNDDAFAVIRDVTIRGNRFRGGGGYAVSMLLPPNDRLSTPAQRIVVEGNEVGDRVGAFQAYGFGGSDAATSSRGYDIAIRDNIVRRCTKPFVINGIRDLSMTGNEFTDCAEHGELGYNATVARIAVSDNLFQRIGGATTPYGLWLRDSIDVAIERNRFVDCGTPGQRNGVGVGVVQGVSRRLRFADNRFTAPSGRMTQPVVVFRGARVDSVGLTMTGNTIGFPSAPIANLLVPTP